jgi:hypothetical protein
MNITKRIITALVLVSFVCFTLTGCFTDFISKEKERREMEAYLEETYDREFVVEKPYSVGFPWGGGYGNAKAYPKDDPELRFEMTAVGENSYMTGYLTALWGKQLKTELENKVKEMYGQDAKLECDIDVHIKDEDVKEVRKMTFSELEKKYEGQGRLSCKISVKFYSDKCVFDTNQEDEAKKVIWFKENHYSKYQSNTFWDYSLILKDIDKYTKEDFRHILFRDDDVYKETEVSDMTIQSILDEFKNSKYK